MSDHDSHASCELRIHPSIHPSIMHSFIRRTARRRHDERNNRKKKREKNDAPPTIPACNDTRILDASRLISAASGIVFKCGVGLSHRSSSVSFVRRLGNKNPNSMSIAKKKKKTTTIKGEEAGGMDDQTKKKSKQMTTAVDDHDHDDHHLCVFTPPGLLRLHLWHRKREPLQLCPLVIIPRRPWTVDEPRQSLIDTWGGSACALCPACLLFSIIDQCRICIMYRSEARSHLDGIPHRALD